MIDKLRSSTRYHIQACIYSHIYMFVADRLDTTYDKKFTSRVIIYPAICSCCHLQILPHKDCRQLLTNTTTYTHRLKPKMT